MDRPRTQVWTWTLLCVFMSWMSIASAAPGPYYTVTIPAVLEARSTTVFCSSLIKPNETMLMTVTLRAKEQNMTLLEKMASQEFHTCTSFLVPPGQDEVSKLEVEVTGQTFHSKEERKVLIKSYKPIKLIQTDKPVYLPGQTVHFRVVSLDSKLRTVIQLFNKIQIEAPDRNKIGQWLNETSDGIILQHSYKLNSEAREGTYKIIVQTGEEETQYTFKVEKYVLPKFEVKIKASEEVSVGQEEVRAEVCAKYTYGQSVPGNIKADLCRPLNLYYGVGVEGLQPPCSSETKPADKFGCAEFIFKMSTFLKLDPQVLQSSLKLHAQVEEEGTGITNEQEKKIPISFVIGKLSFADTPTMYEPGKEIVGQVKAVHYNNTPIPDMLLYLYEGHRRNARLIHQLTTDSEGVAAFTHTPAESKPELPLYLSDKQNIDVFNYDYENGYIEAASHTLSLIQGLSPDVKTVSSMTVQTKDHPIPCDAWEDITIRYSIVGEKQGTAAVTYLILSRGSIFRQGSEEVEVQDKPVTEGQMSFQLRVSPEMAPHVQIVVYAVLPSEAVIAHSADFPTEKCFSHKVSLNFSQDSAVPGEENTLKVTAQSRALCGVSIVDQSVLIKEPGKTLDADKIFALLPVTKVSYIPYEVQDQEECLVVRPKRSFLPPVDRTEDPFTIFKNVGLKMATNLNIRVPTCLRFGGRKYIHSPDIGYRSEVASVAFGAASGGYGGLEPIETVRTFFPETWFWDLVDTGASGTKDVALTVPDTITTWETEAFCLSPQGFGLAPRKEFTVFQPFFLELSLPYSIIRGENFELKATVFNYLSSCIMVSVNPAASLDYTLTEIPGYEYKTCVCSNERKTFKWTLTSTALGDVSVSVTAEALASDVTCHNEVVVPERGRSDTVSKTLKVKAEGVEKKETANWLLCPEGQLMTEEIEIQLPDDVIDGSGHALVSVLGDIMGRALMNLDGLLRVPHGSGEHNVARLAPNIYVLQYLSDSNQLTPAIREKGVDHMITGYQRQLNYKHSSGAFSTYGSGPGNTWLTAFVIRAFVKAQNFIFIDKAVIDSAKAWLDRKQKSNGCYIQQGKLFNNAMKGGVSDEVTITAYVTAAFLEANSTVTDSVSMSLSCLKNSHGDLSSTYATALQAYVFTLVGDMETRETLLKHLDSVAIKDGGFTHWSQTATDSSSSLSVEISSYVLLAILRGPTSPETLGYVHNIARWITSKQNYYGGFDSTQDTVVALQALSLFATYLVSVGGSSEVRVQSPSSHLNFTLNQDNKLLYQEQVLKDVTGKYKVEVEGTACASVQIYHHYNIPPPIPDANFSVEAATKCSNMDASMTLTAKSLYIGESPSNSVLLDIKMLSGHVPDPESLKKLKHGVNVEHAEHKEDHVLVYIKELTKDEPISYELELKQETKVSDLKPAVILIYDLGQPDRRGQTEYSCPCAAA